jgi:hypothetical protein
LTPFHFSEQKAAIARAAGLAVFLFCTASGAQAERPVRVTIQAQPRFENRESLLGADGSFEVRAQLLDDAGSALADAEVGIQATSARNVTITACGAAPARGGRQLGSVQSDATGRVCVRVVGAPRNGSLELTFAGSTVHLPAKAVIALQPAPSKTGLAFESPSLELDLDQDELRLKLQLSGAAADEPMVPIEVSLHDGGRTLPLRATEWSRTGDFLSFSIDARSLGLPGPARLVARRTGAEPSARAEAVALRVASVQLSAEVLGGESGTARVVVSAVSRAGPVPSGWVEASLGGGESIGSAPFSGAVAQLELAPPASGAVSLHYRSDDPWWRPGEPLSLSLHAAPTRSPRRWPWLVLLAPIGYICLRSLQRPALRQAPPRALPKPRGTIVAAPAPAAAPHGWTGSIIDAHDGHPIVGAHVEAILPSFRGTDANTVAVVADERGWFELPALQDPLPEGARLRVWAPLHSDVERPLPPQGRVNVALTSRRRAVLRRLVRWARTLGTPWVRGGEPTPGEIADTAMRRNDPRTARWAEDVQAAVFGEAPVDAALEASLRAAEPGWHETPSGLETEALREMTATRPKPAEE